MVHPSWNDFPNLLAELDWSKNKKLRLRDKIVTPDQLPVGTGKWLDWRCSTCSHEWRALGSNRRKGTGCPACKGSLHSDGRNSMANTHPELAKEYLGDPNKITAGIYKKLDWRCSTCSHEWKTLGTVRKNGSGCPVCTNRTIHSDGRNSMTYTHPELAKEYLGDASKIIAGTHKILQWRCSVCEHEWSLGGNQRTSKKSGCPACNGGLHSHGRNSMANTHPELAKEYLGDANKITASTSKKLDWRCSVCEHEWKAIGSSRGKIGRGCPACANQAIHSDGRNSMANTHPELAKEYLGDAKVMAGTNKYLDWRCSTCSHEWKSNGNNRAYKDNGCPFCSGKSLHLDGRNSMVNTHPELAKEYLGDASKVMAGTNKKLDWCCSICKHEWRISGNSRTSKESGCPACANQAIHSDGRNSMAKTHPELAKEYLGDANKVIAGTNKYLDWRCSDCENQWKASGNNRAYHDRGCAACAKYGYNPEMIGYLYIHHYSDENDNWLKCGITNFPDDRIKSLRKSANKFNLDIIEIEMYKFDDGAIPRLCEKEIMKMADIRFDSNYDIDGKNEFFNYDALGIIKNYILKWL